VEFLSQVVDSTRQFLCPIEGCSKPFLKEKNRAKHMLLQHSLEKPEHYCDICDRYANCRATGTETAELLYYIGTETAEL